MYENHTVGSEIRREHHRKDGAKTLVNNEISTTVPSTLSVPNFWTIKVASWFSSIYPVQDITISGDVVAPCQHNPLFKQNHPDCKLTCWRMDSTVGLRVQKPIHDGRKKSGGHKTTVLDGASQTL